jgi:glutathione S-transferase
MIRLYHYRNNIWTVCVRLVLAEKGLEYEMVHVDLFAGEHLKPEFLALNPYHKVPLLLDGATAVPESWIINEYLEDRYPSPSLMPRDLDCNKCRQLSGRAMPDRDRKITRSQHYRHRETA